MGARPDGRQHLLGFGGGEHEDQVLRRLLDDLQQRVEARRGDHVRFVDDEDAVPRLGGRVERPVAQFAGVVDAAVAGGVEFDDVDVAGPVGRQRDARVAHAARGGRRALLAVQRAGQDARRRGLAAAARPGEQVGVVDPARRQRRRQRFGDVLLADHFGERRRSVLAVESHGEQATQARSDERRALVTLPAATRSPPAAHTWPGRRSPRAGRASTGTSARSECSCRPDLFGTGTPHPPR